MWYWNKNKGVKNPGWRKDITLSVVRNTYYSEADIPESQTMRIYLAIFHYCSMLFKYGLKNECFLKFNVKKFLTWWALSWVKEHCHHIWQWVWPRSTADGPDGARWVLRTKLKTHFSIHSGTKHDSLSVSPLQLRSLYKKVQHSVVPLGTASTRDLLQKGFTASLVWN
jgi:hypothetical protein